MKPICAALLASWIAASAHAADWSFRKVADTDTIAPGAVSDFALFRAPALDGETLAFFAVASGAGIWVESSGGRLRPVAQAGESVPDDADDFLDFGDPVVAKARVVFRAGSLRTRRSGVYVYGDGALRSVARSTSGPARGAFEFLSFGSIDIADGAIAFAAVAADPTPTEGIYARRDDQLVRLVDEDSGAELGNRFEALRSPGLDGETVVFLGRAPAARGIYARRGDTLVALVDDDTPIPEGDGSFRDFDSLSTRGGGLAFVGKGAGDQRGVYVLRERELQRVADRDGRVHEFFPAVSVDGPRVAFHARGRAGEGIWADLGDGPALVIDVSQELDGRELSFLALGARALSGEAIAFRAGFAGGSEGIYVATPE